jgi:hypothetical protein
MNSGSSAGHFPDQLLVCSVPIWSVPLIVPLAQSKQVMNSNHLANVRQRLIMVLNEMQQCADEDEATSRDEFTGFFASTIEEWICYANELGIAYESMVCSLEQGPFTLSGKAAVALLEVGLLFGFKTDRPEDQPFDRRSK